MLPVRELRRKVGGLCEDTQTRAMRFVFLSAAESSERRQGFSRHARSVKEREVYLLGSSVRPVRLTRGPAPCFRFGDVVRRMTERPRPPPGHVRK